MMTATPRLPPAAPRARIAPTPTTNYNVENVQNLIAG